MKAGAGAGRISAAKSMSTVRDDAGSRNKGAGRLDRERPSCVERGMKKNEEDERKDSRFKLIVAIERWVCLVLGVLCIASGTRGVFLKLSQNALPASLAWLAIAYVPTLRIAAVACLVMGLVLVRRGLA
jgi:hypothetical protein